MPTYQYACTECSAPLEVVQAFTDDALTECPSCGGRLRKLYNAVGIVFKGSGFYRTDSRASANGSDPAKAESSKSDAAKSDAAKPDGAKPDGAKSDRTGSTTGKPESGKGPKPSGSGADKATSSSGSGSSAA